MKRMRAILGCTLICFFAWGALHAQQPATDFQVRVSAVNSNDGLSQGFISCMLQDKRGYVWVATKDGLNRYDGYGFTVFRHDVDNPNSLVDNFIFHIFEDSRGLLWITTSKGLDVFDPVRETFTHVSFVPAGFDSKGEAKFMNEDAFGNLWYMIDGRCVYMTITKTGNGKKSLTPDFSYATTIGSSKLSFLPAVAEEIFIDQDGGMWVTAVDALFYTSKNDQTAGKLTKKYDPTSFCQLPDCKILNIISRSPERSVYFITSAGIAIYDLATAKIIKSVPKEILPISNHNAVGIDPEGNAWFYTDEGMTIFQAKTGIFRKMSTLNIDAKTWSNYTIRSVLIDRSGIVWFGTNGFSIFKYNPQVSRFNFIELSSVTSIAGDNKGRIFIGVNSDKLIFNPSTSLFEGNAFRSDKFRVQMVGDHAYPGTINQDRDGIFWLGYGHGYLGRYDEQKDDLKIFGNSGAHTGSSAASWLDKNDDPWIVLDSNSTYYLRRLVKATGQFAPLITFPEKQEMYAYQLISAIYVSAANEFWFGTTQGLFCYSPANGKWKTFKNIPGDTTSLSSNIIFSLCGDPVDPNILWIGTNGAGLNRFNIAAGKFTRFTEQDGLPNNVVYGILADEQKNLWLSTNRGLCRFNIETHQCKNFYQSNGLQGNEFNRYAYYKSKDGALFFGGLDGFNFFYPNDLNETSPPPQIIFTGVRLFNVPVSFRDSTLINKPLDFMEALRLQYDQNVVTIEFAAMDFSASDKNQFQYKLEGFDKDWTFSGTRREAIYTGLTPGEYVFKVKAANSEGVWSETGRSIRITVLPPWWKTWWARTLFVALGISLLVLFIWLRTSSLRRTQAMLEHKVKERTQELNETITNLKQTQAQLVQNEKLASFGQLTAGIAHEIKNPLNFINNFSELGQELITELHEAKTDEEREEIIEMLKGNLSKINFHGLRVDSIIKSMLDHSRTAGSQKLLTDLNKLCDDYSNLAYHSIRANVQDFSCNLKKQFDYDLPSMNLNSQDISRVLLNMLNNAFYAVNEKRKTAGPEYNPEVIISTSRVKNTAMLVVYDNGCGISDEMKNKVFKPFFTSKRPGEGTGLGLSISYDIIQSHGGQMQMESTLNEFTRFTIRIPITDPDKIPLT
jgi:signal transduction histidine kinase/ligand-binding sensor domain-containing protein